jgi:ABC-type multidrug transport system permease subunit
MYGMLSLMIGGVYVGMSHGQTEVQDRAGLLFYVAAFMVFMAIAVVPTFIQERAVVLRERNNGWYSEAPYVLAHTVCSIPGVFVLSFVSSVVICMLSGVSDEGSRFGYFVLNLFLSLMVAESFMTVISAIAPIYIIGMGTRTCASLHFTSLHALHSMPFVACLLWHCISRVTCFDVM